jgi:hypothetical protein
MAIKNNHLIAVSPKEEERQQNNVMILPKCQNIINKIGNQETWQMIQTLLPDNSLLNMLHNSKRKQRTVAILDIDSNSWQLFLNHASNLLRIQSKMIILGISYSPNVCDLLHNQDNVLCFYNEDWILRLESFEQHRKLYPFLITPFMIGRLMVGLSVLCNGYDIFFYRY